MAWTYDATALATTPKDQVRFKLGDTNADAPLLQDEEINFLLLTNSVDKTALKGCEAIIALLSREPTSFSVGPYSESSSDRLTVYKELYTQLCNASVTAFSLPVSKVPTTPTVFRMDMMSRDREDEGDE